MTPNQWSLLTSCIIHPREELIKQQRQDPGLRSIYPYFMALNAISVDKVQIWAHRVK